MSNPSSVTVRTALLVIALGGIASAQAFQSANGQIPGGSGGFSENIDFADIDHDGDRDAIVGNGGDAGNELDRLWVNRGFEAGGTIGFFVDRTAAQFPNVLDDTRDVDFVDIDADGDFDLYVSNTSITVQQSNRWMINMGGMQGGTEGFFQEQTSTRWTFIAVNNGTTHLSSVAPSLALGGGGFVDWSCDCVFGDLDNDGDEDLFHSTYGGAFNGNAPSRIFLNDGGGFFEEFNPSGYQLSSSDLPAGQPALWCQGTQQSNTTNTTGTNADICASPLGIELGDLDGDLDIDILHGARNETPTRFYRSRLTDTGSFTQYRDVTNSCGHTGQVVGQDNYEQELGDFDNDNDLDLYGLNWPGPGSSDVTGKNNGSMVFGSFVTLASSSNDDNEGDFVDYDNDGDLDLYICAFFSQNRLYRNDSAGTGWTHVTASQLPSLSERSLGGDSCDVDHDGDYDMMVANDGGDNEHFYKNVTQVADAIAPRVNHLEQAPNRVASLTPTAIRVHVYDNASWDVTRYDTVTIEYSCNNFTSFYSSPMKYAGGQLFRGTIRGDVTGTVSYRVRAIDEHGNNGLSTTLSFTATGCAGNVFTYCTSGTSTNGCTPQISAVGTPSATALSGFTINVTGLEGQKSGLIFYSISGPKTPATVWQPGSNSVLCVKSPTQRMVTQSSGGTAGACDGTFTEDWNAYMSSHLTALGQPLTGCTVVDAQAWYRDPPAPGTTNLSNALEFTVCN